jgi:hypothetical protein
MTAAHKTPAGSSERHPPGHQAAEPAHPPTERRPAAGAGTHGPRTPNTGGPSGLTDAATVASGRHSAGGAQPAGAPQVGGATPGGSGSSGDSEQTVRHEPHESPDPEGANRSRSF